MSKLTILHNCVQEKGDHESWTVADVLKYLVVEVAGDTLETFFQKNAFARRDLLKELVPKALEELGDLQVIARWSMDPDEKVLLAALSLYSTSEYTARA